MSNNLTVKTGKSQSIKNLECGCLLETTLFIMVFQPISLSIGIQYVSMANGKNYCGAIMDIPLIRQPMPLVRNGLLTTEIKMNTQIPNRKKLVYGRQATLDKWIETYKEKGYRLCSRITDYWKNGKVVYIAELEKEQ